jgi:hypothetical protein
MRILLLLILLTGCSESTKISQDFERTELEITVVFHENKEALNDAYNERFGAEVTEKEGFAVYANPGNEPYWCEIHTLRPQKTDDDRMLTMGHELSHCVFGQFH